MDPELVGDETVAEVNAEDSVLAEDDVLAEDEILVEDISIDGMCGVY